MTCDLEGSAPFLGQGVDLSRGNKTEKKVESNDAIYFFLWELQERTRKSELQKEKKKNRETGKGYKGNFIKNILRVNMC